MDFYHSHRFETTMTRGLFVVLAAVLLSAGTTQAVNRLVTSKDIRNGTIQPIDLSAKARKGMRGTTGPVGPAGPRGLQGETGARGPSGFQSVLVVSGPQVQVPPGSYATSTAYCPYGTRATGGGWQTFYTTLVANDSHQAGDAWQVTMLNLGSNSPSFSAQVVCASSS